MAKRLLFILVYALCFPLLFLALFVYVLFAVVALVIYIIQGDEEDNLIEFIPLPIRISISLPYVIMGEMKFSEI